MFLFLLTGAFFITPGSSSSLFPEFSDQILYDISWNGPLSEQEQTKNTKEKVVITTHNNNKYQCLLPNISENDEDSVNVEDGPSPEALMTSVLAASPQKCSYRLEPYWSYELCHGKYIVQFHEEKDSEGNTKKDEYKLGEMTTEELSDVLAGPKPIEPPSTERRKVSMKLMDGKETPYFSVEMSNGSPCDLSGRPRKSKVLYVCHLGANNEVISVKEVTTCEYEVVVLTPIICGNPAYRVKNDPINKIQCHSMEGSPSRPLELLDYYEDGDMIYIEKPTKFSGSSSTPVKPPVDERLNRNFLEGKYCLTGGTGWWNYEFCNGKHVQQFHKERNKPKVIINLGYWDRNVHLKMVEQKKINPKGKKHVAHWYSNGDICDLTGQPRSAVVMLKCAKGSGQQLAIYMTEPTTCHYHIGVESPILCPFIEKADANGLFDHLL